MKFEELMLAGRWAMVMTPKSHYRVGRERLESLRHPQADESSVDDALLRGVREARHQPVALIFRGSSDDGVGSWSFDEELTQSETEELGYLMIKSMLPLYRQLASLGVMLFLKVEWGPTEVNALEGGAHRVATELEGKLESMTLRDTDRATAELDVWMLRHLSYWMLMSYEDCAQTFLPRTLPRLDARRAKLDRLVADLSLSHLG